MASIAPTVHTERHSDAFGPPLQIPETPEQLAALGNSFNSRGYLDVKRDSDGRSGLGEVLENSTPKAPKETGTIGDQIAAAFGFGGGGIAMMTAPTGSSLLCLFWLPAKHVLTIISF